MRNTAITETALQISLEMAEAEILLTPSKGTPYEVVDSLLTLDADVVDVSNNSPYAVEVGHKFSKLFMIFRSIMLKEIEYIVSVYEESINSFSITNAKETSLGNYSIEVSDKPNFLTSPHMLNMMNALTLPAYSRTNDLLAVDLESLLNGISILPIHTGIEELDALANQWVNDFSITEDQLKSITYTGVGNTDSDYFNRGSTQSLSGNYMVDTFLTMMTFSNILINNPIVKDNVELTNSLNRHIEYYIYVLKQYNERIDRQVNAGILIDTKTSTPNLISIENNQPKVVRLHKGSISKLSLEERALLGPELFGYLFNQNPPSRLTIDELKENGDSYKNDYIRLNNHEVLDKEQTFKETRVYALKKAVSSLLQTYQYLFTGGGILNADVNPIITELYNNIIDLDFVNEAICICKNDEINNSVETLLNGLLDQNRTEESSIYEVLRLVMNIRYQSPWLQEFLNHYSFNDGTSLSDTESEALLTHAIVEFLSSSLESTKQQ